MIKKVVFSLLLIVISIPSFSQEVDSLNVSPADTSILIAEHIELFVELSDRDPQRAALLSAMLPGLGQVYNKQYWKLPFIIGGAVAFGHYIKYQDRIYQSFRSAYIAEVDLDPSTINPYADSGLSAQSLETIAQQTRRDRDYLMILAGLTYVIQIVDAHVSAHLHEFQINEELSMNIVPTIQAASLNSRSVGVSLSFNLK